MKSEGRIEEGPRFQAEELRVASPAGDMWDGARGAGRDRVAGARAQGVVMWQEAGEDVAAGPETLYQCI